jgi:hypothetical protein
MKIFREFFEPKKKKEENHQKQNLNLSRVTPFFSTSRFALGFSKWRENTVILQLVSHVKLRLPFELY